MRLFLPLMVILFVFVIGTSTNYVFAELDANNAYVLEGSGFAVTETSIKTSQIDFALTIGSITNGRGGINIDDGFITLDDDDYIIDSISGTILRDGKFLRISGTAEDSSGNDIDVRVFGRLIEDSTDGSVYSFTGRISQNNVEYKILYTSKISGFDEILSTPTQSPSSNNEQIIRIIKGASAQGFGTNYIGSSLATTANYFSVDRLTIEPGSTVKITNDDTVAHTIVSGSGSSNTNRGAFVLCSETPEQLPKGFSYTQSNCSYTLDGRINTGEILPGQSIDVTFNEKGFYRLIDPNYPWMTITVYSFDNVDSLIINQGKNQFN